MTGKTKESKAAARGEELDFTALWPVFGQLNGSAMGEMTRRTRSYFEGLSQFNEEAMSFFTARLRDDLDYGQQLAACDSFAQMARLQQNWFERATRDYSEETLRMLDLASKVTQTSWAPGPQEQPKKQAPEKRTPEKRAAEKHAPEKQPTPVDAKAA